MTDTKRLGAELGDEFARERTEGSPQDLEAKQLINMILKREPKIKLPRLLAHDRVKAWQQETGVTDAQLKRALTNARAEQRGNSEPEPIRVPRRTRNRTATRTASPPQVTAQHGHDLTEDRRGVVPNRDLTLL